MKVIIIGAGPAGLLLGKYLLNYNEDVVIIDRTKSLHCTYCVWEDEIDSWCKSIFENSYSNSYDKIIIKDMKNILEKQYGYHLLDNQSFREKINIPQIDANVIKISYPFVFLDNGEIIEGDYIIDATGSESKFQSYPEFNKMRQSFYGEKLVFENGHGYDINKAILMDFSIDLGTIPTFLYCLPLNENEIFFEETVLSSKNIMSKNELKVRLEKRLDLLNNQNFKREFMEHCLYF